jgi:hypothetical protein
VVIFCSKEYSCEDEAERNAEARTTRLGTTRMHDCGDRCEETRDTTMINKDHATEV